MNNEKKAPGNWIKAESSKAVILSSLLVLSLFFFSDFIIALPDDSNNVINMINRKVYSNNNITYYINNTYINQTGGGMDYSNLSMLNKSNIFNLGSVVGNYSFTTYRFDYGDISTVPSMDFKASSYATVFDSIAFPLSDGGGSIDFSFKTFGGGALTEKLRIRGNGRIGINTSDPSHLLNVFGSANITGPFYLGNSKCSTGQALSTDSGSGLVSCIDVSTSSGGMNYTNVPLLNKTNIFYGGNIALTAGNEVQLLRSDNSSLGGFLSNETDITLFGDNNFYFDTGGLGNVDFDNNVCIGGECKNAWPTETDPICSPYAYNQTTATYNMYGNQWYNHTLATYNLYGSQWYNHTLATYNLYGAQWYNHTTAVNTTYGRWFYNQTTAANTYTDQRVIINNLHKHNISNITGIPSCNSYQVLTNRTGYLSCVNVTESNYSYFGNYTSFSNYSSFANNSVYCGGVLCSSLGTGSAGGDMVSMLVNNYSIVSTNTTLNISLMNIIISPSGDLNLTLPNATANKNKFVGISVSQATKSKLFTINAIANQYIDGLSNRVMWTGESAILLSDGANWTKVGGVSRPMICSMTKTGGDQTLNSATVTVIAIDTVISDNTGRMCDATNNRINILRAGSYQNGGSASFKNMPVTPRVFSNGKLNGATYLWQSETTANTGTWPTPFGFSYTSNSKGDYLQLTAYQDSGSAQQIDGVNTGATTYSVEEKVQW